MPAFTVKVNTDEFKQFSRSLLRASAMTQVAYRLSALSAARMVMADAQARAHSSRIASSMRVVPSVLGADLVIGGMAAPEAAPIENRGKGFVTHPVFGNMEVLTNKNSRPAFLGPAMVARQQHVLDIEEAAVFGAIRRELGSSGF